MSEILATEDTEGAVATVSVLSVYSVAESYKKLTRFSIIKSLRLNVEI